MISSTTWWVRGYRLFFAFLALIALIAQLMQSIGAQRSTINFFSYFTILSNMIAVAVLLWVAFTPEAKLGETSRDLIRGAPVLYLAVTGVVFALLLSDQPLVTVPFSNTVLHKLMPVVMVVDWILDPPQTSISFRQATFWWLIYPVVWLIYTMIRGAIIGWYPYPFMNPSVMGGYGPVLGILVGIILGASVFILAIIWIGRGARRWAGG